MRDTLDWLMFSKPISCRAVTISAWEPKRSSFSKALKALASFSCLSLCFILDSRMRGVTACHAQAADTNSAAILHSYACFGKEAALVLHIDSNIACINLCWR